MRVPWTARRSNQIILKEINPEYSWGGIRAEALILWPPDAKTQLIGKDPDAEKNGRQKEKSMRMDSTTDSMDMNLSKLWEMVKDRGAWRA